MIDTSRSDMRVFVNLVDGQVADRWPVRPGDYLASLKALKREPVLVRFHREGIPELLLEGSLVRLSLRRQKTGDTTLLGQVSDFIAPDTASGFYAASLNLATTAVQALLDGGPDRTFWMTTGALEWRGADEAWQESQDLRFNLQRPVGDDGEEPVELDGDLNIVHVRPLITAITGGGAEALDAMATAGLAVGWRLELVIGDVIQDWQLQDWQLQAWTDEADNPVAGVLLPLDHHPITNPKFWKQLR